MNLQFYLDKVKNSKEFKKFIKENPDAFLTSGFFVIDKTGKEKDKYHLDYFISSKKEMVSFDTEILCKSLPKSRGQLQSNCQEFLSPKVPNKPQGLFDIGDGIIKIPVEIIDKTFVYTPLNGDFDLTFEKLEKMIRKEMEKREIKNEIQKIIFAVQNKDGTDFFLCTIFISGLGLIKVYIDGKKKKIVEFEKKSFFDILKVKKKEE